MSAIVLVWPKMTELERRVVEHDCFYAGYTKKKKIQFRDQEWEVIR